MLVRDSGMKRMLHLRDGTQSEALVYKGGQELDWEGHK